MFCELLENVLERMKARESKIIWKKKVHISFILAAVNQIRTLLVYEINLMGFENFWAREGKEKECE
jgi:hypothetical protein